MTVADHTGASIDSVAAGLETALCCLFCGGRDADNAVRGVRDHFFKADRGSFDFQRCHSCGSLWLSRRPFGQRLVAAYEGYYTHANPKPAPPRSLLRARLRAAYVARRFAEAPSLPDRFLAGVLRLTGRKFPDVDMQYRCAPKAPAHLLDYGCGSGEYLLRMVPFGHQLQGTEYDPRLVSTLTARGIPVADVETLDDATWTGRFDHITLAHVIEHVPNPSALLRRLSLWLRPGGTIFLEVPNADATGLAIFGGYWRGLEAPRHFALPTARALHEALAAVELRTLQQHIDRAARRWVWQESLDAAPKSERKGLLEAMMDAAVETPENSEFLTFVVRKPT